MNASADVSTLACGECGCSVPADPAERADWQHGPLLHAGELGEDTAALLLCPDCRREHRTHEYEQGSGD